MWVKMCSCQLDVLSGSPAGSKAALLGSPWWTFVILRHNKETENGFDCFYWSDRGKRGLKERKAAQQLIDEVTLDQWMSGSLLVFQDHLAVGQRINFL